ncbi:MAG: hypothetical protein MIL41_24605 [Hyphomicrobiales bacterium]|jgi:predicted metal-binding protein
MTDFERKPYMEDQLASLGPDWDGAEKMLKSLATYLKKRDGLTHAEALDEVARRLGYRNWVSVKRYA